MTTTELMQQHHPIMMTCPNIYYAHPFYRQQQQRQHFHPLGGHSYRGESEFRPSFYNPFEIKHRRRTSRAQLKVLEKSFLENAKPNASVRRYLAQELDMTPRGVQIWFQNRRAKTKLQKRKSLQQQQQQQQPTPNSPNYNTINNSNSFSITSDQSSSTFDSVSPLFYPMGIYNSSSQVNQEKSSTNPSLFMSDQSWLAMPMHPLSSSDCNKNVMQQQNIPDCAYLPSPTTPMSTKSNDDLMTAMMTPWTDRNVYPAGGGSSTPGWSLDTDSTHYPSPLSDYHPPVLLDHYQAVQGTSSSTSSSSFSFGSYTMDPVPSSCSLDYRNY